MAVLYTPEEIQAVLKELRIKPLSGGVTTREAARILSWRARAEYGVEHSYNESAVRRHVQSGNLKATQVSTRFNRYKVEALFDVPLAPRRGIQPKQMSEENPRWPWTAALEFPRPGTAVASHQVVL